MVKRGGRPAGSEQTSERSSRVPAASAPRLPSLTRTVVEPPPLRPARAGAENPARAHDAAQRVSAGTYRAESLSLIEEARALGRDEREARLLEQFFSWPPPPAAEFVPEPFERAPMRRGSRRAMLASIVMLVASVALIGGFVAYHNFVMPRPVELGEWSDADALMLPTQSATSDSVGQPETAPVHLYASLQHDLSAVQQAEPVEDEAAARPDTAAALQPDTAEAPQGEPTTNTQPPATAAPAPDRTETAQAERANDQPAQPTAPSDVAPSFDAQLAHARQLLEQGELQQSLQQFERALELRAGSVDALLGKAAALFALQDYETARSSAQQAIAIDPRSSEGLMLVASSFERLGDREAAKLIYERCVDEAVDGAPCRARLSEIEAK